MLKVPATRLAPAPPSTTAAVASAVLVVMWSSGFIGAELGTRFAPASTLLAWRFVTASVILLALCWWRGLRVSRAAIVRQGSLGLLCQCLYLSCTVGGVGLGVPASTTALVASLQPLVVAAAAGAVLGERTARLQRIGLLVGLMGVLLVVGGDLSSGSAPGWAYALPVAGMLGLASGTLTERRLRPQEPLLAALTIQTVTGAVFFVVLALVEGSLTAPATPAFYGSVGWVVLLSSFGGYGMYIFVLRSQGATRVSTLLYLTPPTTMLWAFVMFGDPVHPLGLLGLLVAAVGVGLTLRRPQRAGAVQRADRRLPR